MFFLLKILLFYYILDPIWPPQFTLFLYRKKKTVCTIIDVVKNSPQRRGVVRLRNHVHFSLRNLVIKFKRKLSSLNNCTQYFRIFSIYFINYKHLVCIEIINYSISIGELFFFYTLSGRT